jgi:hypothetical protein
MRYLLSESDTMPEAMDNRSPRWPNRADGIAKAVVEWY